MWATCIARWHRSRMVGDDTAETRHAFVEFNDKNSANAALVLNGQVIGDKVIKVGLAKNAITKPMKSAQEQRKLDQAMRKVKAAQASMAAKFAPDKKSKSRSRSPRRDTRRSDRSRKESKRSRSRDSRHSRRDRSTDRRRDRSKRRERSCEKKVESKADKSTDKPAPVEPAAEPDYAALLEEFE